MTHPSVAPMITYLFGELLFGVDSELLFGVDGELLFGIGDGLRFGLGGGLLFVGVDKYVVPGIFGVDVGVNDVSVGTGTWLEGLLCGDSVTIVGFVVVYSGADCPGSQVDAISCEYFANMSGHTTAMHGAISFGTPSSKQ